MCYKDYCKLYYANIILTNQLKVLLEEKNELMQKMNKCENRKRPEEILPMSWAPSLLKYESKKRHRRTAEEIERHYKCPVPGCMRSYGAEGSLTQHIKMKHKDFLPDSNIPNGGSNGPAGSMGSSMINPKNINMSGQKEEISDSKSLSESESLKQEEQQVTLLVYHNISSLSLIHI
eukprot:TRINITY_DN560_c0_g3_i1.p1 TRINITY_DN560_c0_g3~~TRINITY_DN560_c0_g3_i1.p1  ORF type:complete len:176 (-),score=28.26 TRINITY_DN560_c0_g3_i1:12-539(-)